MGKLSFAFVLASSLTAAAQAAISGIKVTPTGVPAFKGRKDVPIAQVTFTASQAAQAEKVRLDIRGTNPSDVLCLSLGQSECARVANDAATFTVPVKAGENTFPLFAQLSDEATVSGSLCIAGERIRIGSVVTRPAQEISDRRLPDGRLRASKNFRIPGIVKTPKGNLVAVFDIRYKHAGDLPADITVGASTSADGGNTWSPIVTAMDYAGTPGTKQGIGDPAILVDPSNNRLWIMAMRTPDSGHPIWSSAAGTTGHETCAQLYVAYSDDEGKTWSKGYSDINLDAWLQWRNYKVSSKFFITQDPSATAVSTLLTLSCSLISTPPRASETSCVVMDAGSFVSGSIPR